MLNGLEPTRTSRKKNKPSWLWPNRNASHVSTLDALSAHIAILDADGVILATNRAWREFRVANSMVNAVDVGFNYLAVCDKANGAFAEEGPAVAAGIRAVIRREKESFALEYPCHSPSEKRWFLVRATRFGGDDPLRIVIAHENITAAKLAENEREKFVAIVENSTDFIGLATLSGEVIYTNTAARALVGFDPALDGGVNRIVDFYTDEGKRVLEGVALPALMATGRWEGELQFRNFRNGLSIDTDSSIFIVRHPTSGEPECMATVTRDITQKKRQAEELRSKTAFLEAQIESSLDGLLIVDDKQHKLLQNQQFADIWQIPQDIFEHSRDADTREFCTSKTKDPEAFLERVTHLYAHPNEKAREDIELADGRVLDRYSAPVKDVDGRYYGRIWTFRDITERKRQEEQLRRGARSTHGRHRKPRRRARDVWPR